MLWWFVICHFLFFSWEIEGHVNKFSFLKQEELGLRHRLEHRNFCLNTVISGLSIFYHFVSHLSNRDTCMMT